MTRGQGVLLGLGIVTMTIAGALFAGNYLAAIHDANPLFWRDSVPLSFFGYTLPMLAIIGAHEAGHVWACRRHGIATSGPWLLPIPLPLTGHGGAWLRLKDPPTSRRAMFDIGAAGPVAGFLATLPILVAGIWLSASMPLGSVRTAARYRMPEVMGWLASWRFESTLDVVPHPLAWAAWVGLVLTFLNLLPFMQLDGGQILLSLVPGVKARFSSWLAVSFVVFVFAGVMAMLHSASWSLFWLAMVLMAMFSGLRPVPLTDETPLGSWRWLAAVACAVILFLSATPIEAW